MKNILKKSLILSFYELKSRNHNTYLGFFWYFLQPLMMFVVLFYVKKSLLGLNIDNFVPYLFVGVIIVHFFISSTTLILESITKNYDLLGAKKIDPEIFVFSKLFVSVWQHIFEAVLVIFILTIFGYYHSVLYFLIIPIYMLFVLGIGKILCVLSTKMFDITYIWNYFCQILWFILPVYYLSGDNFIVKYNPISYFLEMARGLTYDFNIISMELIFYCILFSFGSLLVGNIIFNYQKGIISERIK